MPGPYNIQSIQTCFAKAKQVDPVTANDSADMIHLNKINATMLDVSHVTENDAAWVGKGTEFATTAYKVNSDVKGSIEKYASSEFLAWAFAFGFGKSTPTTGQYVITPLKLSDGINLPTFSYVEQISSALDRMAVGCAVENLNLSVKSGPGLASATCKVDFIGTGLLTESSGITIPAATTEHPLYAATAAISAIGKDYVTSKDIISLDFTWGNAVRLPSGFYPGSGVDAHGFATRGRIEYGARTCGLTYTARYESNSDELAKLQGLTQGTVSIELGSSGGADYFHLALPHALISSAVVGDTDGIVTINVSVSPLMDTSTMVLGTATVKTALAGIAV